MNRTLRLPGLLPVIAVAVLLAPPTAHAQNPCCGTISTTLVKTFAKVHVAELELTVDAATAAKVGSTIGGASKMSNDLADKVAADYSTAATAQSTLHFVHNISGNQFFGGQTDSFNAMVKAGLLTQDQAEQIQQDSRKSLAFIDTDGIKPDDKLIQALTGDTLTTRYITADGTTKVTLTRVGAVQRAAFFGDYFAPGSDFRKGLMQSALDSAQQARGD